MKEKVSKIEKEIERKSTKSGREKKSKSREMMKNDSNDKISTATEMSFIFVLNSI